MAQTLTHMNAIPDGGRARVRTPGKYIILWLFIPVVLVAIGAGVWLNIKNRQSHIAALEYRTGEAGVKAAYFTLPEFLVDLSPDRSGRTAYLKMKAVIAIDGDEAHDMAALLDAHQPLVVERLTFFLRELRPEDFQGSEAMARITGEMARRVNLVISPGRVRGVVIEDLVIQ